ncbi:hypothetical protein WOLCODRAFT_145036 [Wolfiporia cocos MD-104 SS10]|uniref:Uncharacterized protein n=1 Tax=Wolfiporia cocos (strain MD-104) TaxID=742152 RepID=A0A2H3JQW6_WOLCO|nr:hypothetical protein WOLCODRAFT_145036 [Wolfiporia cocos MD-104 SS10]
MPPMAGEYEEVPVSEEKTHKRSNSWQVHEESPEDEDTGLLKGRPVHRPTELAIDESLDSNTLYSSKTLVDDVEPNRLPALTRSNSAWVRFRAWVANVTWRLLICTQQHWIIVSVSLVLAIVSISMSIGWSMRLSGFAGVQNLDIWYTDNPTAVRLRTNLVAIDSEAQTMTLDWWVDYRCPYQDCLDVDVYIDRNYLRSKDESSDNSSTHIPDPIFVINGTEYLYQTRHSDYRYGSAQFRTIWAITNVYAGGRSAQAYPFDKYFATLICWAETSPGAESVKVGIVYTGGIVVGYNVILEDRMSGDAPGGTLLKNMVVTRGLVIRLYTVIIVLAIWLITLVLLFGCITTVIFGKGVKPDLLVLPVTALFSFTSLRATFPGAPDTFGADIVRPCMRNINRVDRVHGVARIPTYKPGALSYAVRCNLEGMPVYT